MPGCGGFLLVGRWTLLELCWSRGAAGVHVGHAIIDGVIDIPKTKEYMKDIPDGKIDPDAVSITVWETCFVDVGRANVISSLQIAEAYWHLHTQPRTCFTHEIDVRPYIEKW